MVGPDTRDVGNNLLTLYGVDLSRDFVCVYRKIYHAFKAIMLSKLTPAGTPTRCAVPIPGGALGVQESHEPAASGFLRSGQRD